jgi:NAD-dependent deacetylase
MSTKKKLVVLSGAGISAESGLSTFRDAGGLWEGYKIEDVATPEAWRKDRALVLEFYNLRRKNALDAKPNAAHLALAKLEEKYDVCIITQNVDHLHEQAGSSNVLHLHGELFKSRSTLDPSLVYPIEGWALNVGDKCEKGSQLRPHIVWFGEAVPMMDNAIEEVGAADIFIVVGTSLQVYPAAGLVDYVHEDVPKYIIDPKAPVINHIPNLTTITQKAGEALPVLATKLLQSI